MRSCSIPRSFGPTGDRTPLELFEVNQVDGAIVDGILITDPEARRLERSELPVVSLDWGAGRTRMPWCRWTIWRAHAWRSSTCWSSGMPDRAHLGSRGRRRPDGRSAGRLGGGLCGGGADSDPRLLAYGDFGEAGGHAAMHRLLESSAGPTAVFAFNDLTAVGALRALGQRGLRVPENVSVVGFDDIRVARLRPRR